jgi:beta-lactamase regulating signal transducer with metallopeptidase domain
MTDMLQNALVWLDGIGREVLAWIGSMNAWTAVLFVLAFALDRLLASRVAAAWRVLFYVPIVVRLLLPDSIGIVVPVLASTASIPAAPLVDGTAAVQFGDALGATTQSAITLSWKMTVPLAYLAVAAALLLRWDRERRRLRAVLAASRPAAAWLRGLGREFDIVEHATAGPLLIGVRFPRLVVPLGLRERVGDDGVRAIVRHEASHVRRRDPLIAAVLHLIVIALWPIVAIWCGAARVRTLLEIACDEKALHGADGSERKAYGRTLIEMASLRREYSQALGFSDGLHERIVSLRAPQRRWSIAAQALVALATCGLIVACSSTRLEETEASPATASTWAEEWPADANEIDIRVMRGSVVAIDAEVTSMRTLQLNAILDEKKVESIAAPRLVALTGQPAVITIGNDKEEIRIEAKVIRIDGRLRTISLDYAEVTTIRGAEKTTLAARTVTFQLAPDTTVEVPVAGTVARSLLIQAREPGSRPANSPPILRDLPILSNFFRENAGSGSNAKAEDAEVDPNGGVYPQVLCMMNLIEADGPLYFAKDGVIEQGRNDGPGHRVQSGDLTTKTFDWFQRLKGYRNIAAPALIVALGEQAAIEAASTDKAGMSIGEYQIGIRFVEVDGALRADITWNSRRDDGAFVEVYRVTDVAVDPTGAILAISPTTHSNPSVGRILMLRPSLIRSVKDHPFQRASSFAPPG